MGKIVILDENTANQIAAGEVIERPSSIVKEMVENSIDAGATAVTVEIRNGGIAYLKITDNGSGMEADDVEIAFERHATSKIRKIEDLDKLTTMGFRGEALASIAAVSHLEVKTKTESAVVGTSLKIVGGKVTEINQTGCPTGTTFIIRNLFFNTPARYKFLKKDTTEAGYVSDMMERLALSHPEISFKLLVNQQLQHHTPGNNDLLSVIYSIYGKDTARAVIPVYYEGEGMLISGYIGKPEIARGTRNSQSMFLNGRFIRNRVVSSALEDAYKTVLMQHKFPFCVLNIKARPEFYDVNVHPQKLEVRFSNDSFIYSSIYHAVKNALISTSLLKESPELSEARNTAAPSQQKEKEDIVQLSMSKPYQVVQKDDSSDIRISTPAKRVDSYNINAQTIKQLAEIAADHNNQLFNAWKSEKHVQGETQKLLCNEISDEQGAISSLSKADKPLSVQRNEGSMDSYQKKHAACSSEENRFGADPIAENESDYAKPGNESGLGVIHTYEANREEKGTNRDVQSLLEAELVGQAFETYILLQFEDDLYLIDQHAAHERIRYENLKTNLLEGKNSSQLVMEPFILQLSALELDFVLKRQADFEKIGFELEMFGPGTIIIRSIPDIFETSFHINDFKEILDRWMETCGDKNGISDETLYMMSCKGALKANKRLHKEEINALIGQLAAMENPYTCVHGRPVIIKMTKKELEKRFKRIV